MADRSNFSKIDARYFRLVEVDQQKERRTIYRVRWDRVVPIIALCAFWTAVAVWLF